MEQQPAPVIDVELERKMEAAGDRPVAVVVAFRESMAAPALASVDLYALFARGGATAYGRLVPDAIRRLAMRPDVVRIRWTPLMPARPVEKTAMAKIDSELQQRMAQDADASHNVIVTFTGPVDEAHVDALDLLPASAVEAIGQLSAEAIRALAARADVARIRRSPDVNAF